MALLDTVTDLFVGKSPSRPNTGEFEAANAEIMKKLQAQIPLSFEEERWLGDYNPELLPAAKQLSASRLDGIEQDPRYLDAMFAALDEMEGLAESGLSDADRYAMRQEEKDLNRQSKGRIDSIRQNFASRGLGGSGLDLVAQLTAAGDADEAAADSSARREALAVENRLRARESAGNLAGQLSDRDYQKQRDAALAADEINRFNTANSIDTQRSNVQTRNDASRYNLEGRQGVASRNTGNGNNFAQTTFQNNKDVAGLNYNANAGAANQRLDQYAMDKGAHNSAKSGLLQGAVGLGSAAIMASDKNLKKEVHPLSENEIEDFLNSIQPVNFKYEGTDKPRVGVLAQDIQKGSRVGSEMIREDKDGMKGLDTTDLLGAILSSISYLHKTRKD